MRVRHITAFVGCLAYLLGACATGTPEPTPTPQATVEPSTTTGTEHTLGAGSGWPEGTQDLRTVIFRVTVSGDAKRALSSGDEGYLIIHRIKKNEWAKLIFTNGVRAVYEMPADAYKIVEIGPFTCRNNDFSLPVEPDTEAQINFDIQIFVGKKELQLYLPRRPSNKDETTAAPRTQEPASSKHGSRLADFYRTDTEWAVLDKRMNDMAASDAGSSVDWDDVETAGKVVGIILQALTVVGGVAGGVQF